MSDDNAVARTPSENVSLATIAREWIRLGCIGFGGPPTHIALLRRLCVDERHWLDAKEFEDGIAATNLLPGPASTQLAIFCAWRLRGRSVPSSAGSASSSRALLLILALSVVFLASHPPQWILGAAAGAGAAVPAVALNAAWGLVPGSWKRIGTGERSRSAGSLRVGGRCCRRHGRSLPGARAPRLRTHRDRHPPTEQSEVIGSATSRLSGGRRAHALPSAAWVRWPGWRSRSARSPTEAGS